MKFPHSWYRACSYIINYNCKPSHWLINLINTWPWLESFRSRLIFLYYQFNIQKFIYNTFPKFLFIAFFFSFLAVQLRHRDFSGARDRAGRDSWRWATGCCNYQRCSSRFPPRHQQPPPCSWGCPKAAHKKIILNVSLINGFSRTHFTFPKEACLK